MFQNCYNLEEVILGPSTITMYISTFENSAISKINLEYIKNIHDNAFFGCKNIKHVDIQNVTMFGSYCFSESGLIDFKFIQDVNEVAEGMFQHCVDLETVTLMPRIGIIEGNAFYQCIKLRNIDSLYHITRIGHNAFEYTSLTQIENNEILELDYNAFSNIVTLQSAIFRTIQTNCETFLNCINLKTIEIKEAYYVDLGYNFYNCLSLESFKSGQARVIADYDFANCRNLVTFDVPFVALLLKCCFKNCKPLTHFDYNPDYFYSAAFQGCSKLETVKFLHYGNFYLNTKKSLLGSYRPILSPITEYVFSECTSLKIIDTDYGEKGMFANCFSLTEVNFYGKSLSYGAFLNCINLKTIRFLNDQYSGPFKGDSIPCNCFYGCVNLEEINLPETVKTIENSAFYNTSLKNGIDLKNVQNIKPDSFSYSKVSSLKISKEVNINKNLYTLEHCDELKEIIFAGQGSIPLALLKNCPKFSTLKLSDKFTYQNGIVRRIDSQSGNSIVTYNISYESTEIIIPDDIKNIAFAAFLCSNLIKSIKINHDVKIGNFAFCNMESLEEVEINAKEIPAYCFYNCSKLSKVTLSNIVESIQYQAFSYTKLKQIDLPLSLKNIFRPISFMSYQKNPFRI
ncbi:hypothetical protein TVAG_145120 [Trichomonas vaginalis G3]|uniref:Surface antigen BspA-like n=1 Tax=Trichomonas vaginalis (strain ATCC PRA-98 / G3) TaxID=412133 RepID=A2GB07_TRIV3|nr:hypothetical protein TVAG_145120 [Trichomonas vaginalis G3]|eukprot:XP_001298588.1 hypothetical protein [Trichomonas vaginalis G3]